MKIIARHKRWVADCMITEMVDEKKSTDDCSYRVFTATILGWRKFKIYSGFCHEKLGEEVQAKVRALKKRIEENDETVFTE